MSMIKEYFRMKRMEIKMKSIFYDTILKLYDEKSNIIDLLKQLYATLKDVKPEDLQRELISCIAHLAHEQAVKEREAEKEMS